MKKIFILVLSVSLLGSCTKKLDELLVNPNGPTPESANADLYLTCIMHLLPSRNCCYATRSSITWTNVSGVLLVWLCCVPNTNIMIRATQTQHQTHIIRSNIRYMVAMKSNTSSSNVRFVWSQKTNMTSRNIRCFDHDTNQGKNNGNSDRRMQ
jgi:hypothetical protein